MEPDNKLFAIALAIETGVFGVIAKRLGNLKSWSKLYAAMPADIAAIQSVIKSGREELLNSTEEIINNGADENRTWAGYYYAYRGIEQTDNSEINRILKQNISDAQTQVRTDTSVLGVVKNGKYLQVEDAYKEIVTDAATQMTNGTALDNAIKNATKTLTTSGLKVYYSKTNTTRNFISALTTNVMGSYKTAMNDMRIVQGREFGADAVRVSAHALCAEDHLPYQGRIFKNDQWENIQASLSRQFVYGANCGHTVSPTIYDLAIKEYDSDYVNKLNNMSTEQVTFTGLSGQELTMSRYEASQYQRNLESTIRQTKETAYLNELEGIDTTSLNASAARYTSEYKRISKAAGLSIRLDRVKI